MKNKFHKSLYLVIKLIFSLALLGYLLDKFNIEDTHKQLVSIKIEYLLGACLLIVIQVLIGAIRWYFIIIELGTIVNLINIIKITFIGHFFNQFLPASIGSDFARVWLSKGVGISYSIGVTSVLIDRMGNFLSIIILGIITFLMRSNYVYSSEIIFIISRLSFLFVAIVIILYFYLDHIPNGWIRTNIFSRFIKFREDAYLIFLKPSNVILIFMASVAGQFVLAATVTVLAEGLGLKIGLKECIVTMPMVAVVSALPISIGGWGVREFAMINAFSDISVPASGVLTLSIILAISVIISSLPGGLLWLIYSKK